jgi:hypothetical protein
MRMKRPEKAFQDEVVVLVAVNLKKNPSQRHIRRSRVQNRKEKTDLVQNPK